MPDKSIGDNVDCDRYHGTLPIKTCILRHRMRAVTGCRKCQQGKEREETHGAEYPVDWKTLALQTAAYVAAVFNPPESAGGKED